MTAIQIRRGTPGDQAIYDLVKKLQAGELLLAEPWDDEELESGLYWTRLHSLDTPQPGQCGMVENTGLSSAPEGRPWSGGGIHVIRKHFPTRNEAMSYVDGELRKAGWVLP